MILVGSTSPNTDSEISGAFWRFSLDIYGRPGVAAACLDLQERHGRDVNLVLFAAWIGIAGRGRLTDADFAAAEDAIAPWRRAVVEPLRAVRRHVKESGRATLYEALKAAELDAEHAAQDRLEALVAPTGSRPGATRLDDALANVARYLGAVDVPETLKEGLAALID